MPMRLCFLAAITAEGPRDWDNEHRRIDPGLGHRPTRHTRSKLQYSYQHQRASFQNAEHFAALQLTFRL